MMSRKAQERVTTILIALCLIGLVILAIASSNTKDAVYPVPWTTDAPPEDRELSPEELEVRNSDWWILDHNLAAYEFCAEMDNPYPLFFPLLEFEARFAACIGLNDLDTLGDYVASWNVIQVEQREFKKKFLAATAEYEDRLKIMSLAEFQDSALNWWFSTVSGTPENWRDYWDAADAPLVTLNAEELYYTTKVISIVAGSDFIDQETKMKVGQVFLNRLTSSHFPDSASQVFYQPSQYDAVKLVDTKPSRSDVSAAMALFTTQEEILPADVFYCGTTPIGEIYSEVTIPELGTSLYFGTD